MSRNGKTKHKGGTLSKQPFYLGRYYLLNIAVILSSTVIILHFNHLYEKVSFWWILSLLPLFLNRFLYIIGGSLLLFIITLYVFKSEISWMHFLLLPIAIYIGPLSAVLLHNSLHNNFKPRWLNPIVGEICALQQLSAGASVAKVIHYAHHAFPDDPEKDPHPPKGYTFLGFIDGSRALIQNWMTRKYLENWGDSEKTKSMWKVQNGLLLCSRFVKTFFWFSLFGPKLFVLLFLPSYLANVLFFACFNYYTHPEKEDGASDILNVDNNLFFKICNKVLFGVMYHKNHHLKPRLFNPMLMKPLENTN